MAWSFGTFLILCLCVTLAVAANTKKCNHKFFGCSISNGKCTCDSTKDCINPYPYTTEEECWDDLKGLNDKCQLHPCRNGQCVQVKDFENSLRKWQCECSGTGFYGSRCQHKCPEESDPLPKNFPVPCIY